MLNKNMLILLLAALMLAGCNKEASTDHVVSDKSAVISHTMKPHAPIEMSYSLESKAAAVNETLAIDLIVTANADADALDAVLTSLDDSLSIVDANTRYPLGPQHRNQQNSIRVHVKPVAEGLFYLNVAATLSQNGKSQSRSIAIPVKVGNVNPAKSMKPAGVIESENGERIISVPARAIPAEGRQE